MSTTTKRHRSPTAGTKPRVARRAHSPRPMLHPHIEVRDQHLERSISGAAAEGGLTIKRDPGETLADFAGRADTELQARYVEAKVAIKNFGRLAAEH